MSQQLRQGRCWGCVSDVPGMCQVKEGLCSAEWCCGENSKGGVALGAQLQHSCEGVTEGTDTGQGDGAAHC